MTDFFDRSNITIGKYGNNTADADAETKMDDYLDHEIVYPYNLSMAECLGELLYRMVSWSIEDDIKQENYSNNKVGCKYLDIKQDNNNVQHQAIFKKIARNEDINHKKQEKLANQSCGVIITGKHGEKYTDKDDKDEFEGEDDEDDIWYKPYYDGKCKKAKRRSLKRKH